MSASVRMRACCHVSIADSLRVAVPDRAAGSRPHSASRGIVGQQWAANRPSESPIRTAGQLTPEAIAGHFRQRPRRDLSTRWTARLDAAPLGRESPSIRNGPESSDFSVNAPAGSRTWIYRLGGGRLIHWTTRAWPIAPQGLAGKAIGAHRVRLSQRLSDLWAPA